MGGSRIGGGGRTIRREAGAQQFIINRGLLLAYIRCCGGHLQTDVLLNEGQAQNASCEDEGFTRGIHKAIGCRAVFILSFTLFLLMQPQQ